MPIKRSRIGRSSSFGETGVLRHVSAPEADSVDRQCERRTAAPFSTAAEPSSNSVLTTSVAEKSVESRPRVLTLSSPVQESVVAGDKKPIEGFLEKCYHCKKKIGEDAEVFMYSYFLAFCTAECRDRQIAMDNEAEKASENLKKSTRARKWPM